MTQAVPAFTQTDYEGVTTAYYSADELCRVVNAEKAEAWTEGVNAASAAMGDPCFTRGWPVNPYRNSRDGDAK